MVLPYMWSNSSQKLKKSNGRECSLPVTTIDRSFWKPFNDSKRDDFEKWFSFMVVVGSLYA